MHVTLKFIFNRDVVRRNIRDAPAIVVFEYRVSYCTIHLLKDLNMLKASQMARKCQQSAKYKNSVNARTHANLIVRETSFVFVAE